tara:strand:+ start:682 stop:1650 length:969 start_codon:yes stop_codon:yes gene_type:complete
MGLFSGIKKAFKKVIKGVKKVVKKVVGGVKKVVKKIGSSKILKALAIAAAIVVTGGAAIGAFGGNLATTQFGSWMVGASQKVLGGTLFGTGATTTLGKFAQGTGNFLSKMVAKPFGAVGSTIGNVAGGATDLLGITDKASRMGYMVDPTTGKYVVDSSKTFQDAGRGYFTDDLSGQTLAQTKAGNLGTIGVGKVVDPNTGRVVQGTITGGVVNPSNAPQGMSTGQILKQSAISSGFGLATSAVADKYFSEDPRGSADSLFLEGQTPLDPIRVYASQNNINVSDIYSNPTYGTGDPYYAMNASLFSQDTIGTPTATVTGEYNV